MMSLRGIKDLSRGVGIRAAHAERRPLVIEREDTDSKEILLDTISNIPNLGDYVPEGWIETQRYFVDSSGWSDARELAEHGAFSIHSFLKEVKVGRGYAIVEERQFQIKIGEFVQKGDPQDRR